MFEYWFVVDRVEMIRVIVIVLVMCFDFLWCDLFGFGWWWWVIFVWMIVGIIIRGYIIVSLVENKLVGRWDLGLGVN